MDQTYLEANQIPADATFVKSSRSGAAGHCVELATVPSGVALRHSKDTDRGAFVFTRQEMTAFIEGAKDGDFDRMI